MTLQELPIDTPSYCNKDLCQICDLDTRVEELETCAQNLEAVEYDTDNRLTYLEDKLESIEELLKDLKVIMCGTDVAGNEHSE